MFTPLTPEMRDSLPSFLFIPQIEAEWGGLFDVNDYLVGVLAVNFHREQLR